MSYDEIMDQGLAARSDAPYSALVVGADSTIGVGLLDAFERVGVSAWGTSRRADGNRSRHLSLDLSQPEANWELPDPPADVAFLCAAVTSLAQCANAPATTHAINVLQTVALAKKLIDAGSFVVFLSTNLVLDGRAPRPTASATVNPQTEYGRQKAQAEELLLGLGKRVAVVRFGKIVAPGLPLFESWADSLRQGKPVHPFEDMAMAPVGLSFAIEALLRVAASRVSGIVQVSACRDMSYADAARVIARNVGADVRLIEPALRSPQERALSPAHSAFDDAGMFALGLEAPAPERAFDYFSTSVTGSK